MIYLISFLVDLFLAAIIIWTIIRLKARLK